MAEHDFIVTKLVATSADGTRHDVVIRIGKPTVEEGAGAFPRSVCIVQVQGSTIDDQPQRLYGDEPMQALFFALHTVKENLSWEEQRGVRFSLPEQTSNEPFDWRRFWFGDGEPAAE